MKPRTAILSFVCVEAALYAAFLALDLTGGGGATALKYAGVLLCLAFSLWCAARGGDGLVFPALALTALADLFLLVLDQWYALGVVIFLGAQSVYLIRLRLAAGGRSWWPLRAGLPLLAALVLYQLGQATALNLLALLYFSQLLVNAVLAWTIPGRRWRLFALGLALFVGCDVCVGAFNSPGLVPAGLWQLARVGMWLFYLPSQVLIALSALPEKKEAVP